MGEDKTPPDSEGSQPEGNQPEGGNPEPPPFSPDPRLVTYLERGRKDDAPEKFRKALRDGEDR
jgi:hypothetical protein